MGPGQVRRTGGGLIRQVQSVGRAASGYGQPGHIRRDADNAILAIIANAKRDNADVSASSSSSFAARYRTKSLTPTCTARVGYQPHARPSVVVPISTLR